MPLHFNDDFVPPTNPADEVSGHGIAERIARAKQSIQTPTTPPSARVPAGAAPQWNPLDTLPPLPEISPDTPTPDPVPQHGDDTVDAPTTSSPQTPGELEQQTVEVVTQLAAPVAEAEWTDDDEETWLALRDRLFDPECTDIRILPNELDAKEPYTVAVTINTLNYPDNELIRIKNEASLLRIIKRHILTRDRLTMDVPLTEELPSVAKGTFTYSERAEDGTWETVRARLLLFSPPAQCRTGLQFSKLPKTEFALEDLVNNQTLDTRMAHFLNSLVAAGAALVFSGIPGSGKTVLLNACTRQISPTEMVSVCQDVDELPLSHIQFKEKLIVHRATARHQGSISDGSMAALLDTVKVSRADRVITGEIRDASMLDHLEASSVLPKGSMTTLHAKTAALALEKIHYYAGKGPDAPRGDELWSFVGRNVDVIVQMSIVDGQPRVSQIAAVGGKETAAGAKPPLTLLWELDPATLTWTRHPGPVPDSLREMFARAGVQDYHTPSPSPENGYGG